MVTRFFAVAQHFNTDMTPAWPVGREVRSQKSDVQDIPVF